MVDVRTCKECERAIDEADIRLGLADFCDECGGLYCETCGAGGHDCEVMPGDDPDVGAVEVSSLGAALMQVLHEAGNVPATRAPFPLALDTSDNEQRPRCAACGSFSVVLLAAAPVELRFVGVDASGHWEWTYSNHHLDALTGYEVTCEECGEGEAVEAGHGKPHTIV